MSKLKMSVLIASVITIALTGCGQSAEPINSTTGDAVSAAVEINSNEEM